MQLRDFDLTYDASAQHEGQLVRCTFHASVVDGDTLLHQFVVTDSYESGKVVVGSHFVSLDEGQRFLTLALKPLEGAGRHLLTVAIDGERQAGRLVKFVS
jgi:hypothetical protein